MSEIMQTATATAPANSTEAIVIGALEVGEATLAIRDAYSKSLSQKNTRIEVLNGELDVEYVGGEFSATVSKVESVISKGESVDLSKLKEKELKAIKTSLKYLNESNAVNEMAAQILRMNASKSVYDSRNSFGDNFEKSTVAGLYEGA